MLKRDYAELIEDHWNYQPIYSGDNVYSKNYYRYSSYAEIEGLVKHHTKAELKDLYFNLYHEMY